MVTVTSLEQVRVFVATELHADLAEWEATPYLLPVSLQIKLFPEIDVAKFNYLVGVFPVHFAGVTAGTYAPIDGMRRFIRVQIWQIYDTDGTLFEDEADQVLLQDWIGIVNRTDLENMFGGTATAGDLGFTAFGLASELQHVTVTKTHISKSQIGTDPDDYFEIGRAIGFNEDTRNTAPGNMHSVSGYTGPKIFAKVPNREILDDLDAELADPWTVRDAVEYTLKRDLGYMLAGSTTLDANRIQWDFETQTSDLLDALPTPKIHRDGKTAHQILSELVPKNSGIACRVLFDETGTDTTKLRVFLDFISTAKDSFTIGSYTFPQSPEITDLDLRFSELIEDSFSISESAYDSWDQVVVESAYVTATMTIPLDGSAFVPAWSTSQEAYYVEPDVSGATVNEDKNKLADELRNAKEFQEVFRTWVIKDPAFTTPLIDGSIFYFSPTQDLIDLTSIPEGGTTGILEAFEEAADDYRLDLYRKEFRPEIPIAHRPMKGQQKAAHCFFMTERDPADELDPIDYDTSKWTYGDKLDNAGGWYEGRSWSIQFSAGHAETRNSEAFCGPSVHLDVSGGPQHYIAKDEMADAVYVSPYNDSTTDRVAALRWQDAFVTVTIETDTRFQAKYPETPTLATDAPPRIKRVVFEQCRLDFALPGYVSKIDQDGLLYYTTTGLMFRDDRKLVVVACETIWQQSWIARRPFTVAFSELSPQGLKVGAFVETVESGAGTDTTNTVVSQIEYDFVAIRTRFATQFEETDVVEGLVGVSLGRAGR